MFLLRPRAGGGRKLASGILVRGILGDLFRSGIFGHPIAKSDGSGFHLVSLWHALGSLFAIFIFFENGVPVLARTLFSRLWGPENVNRIR